MKKQLVLILVAASTLLINQGCESQEFVSAKMYVQQEDLDKAEDFFLQALEIESDKDNAEIPYLLAKEVYAKQRRYEEMNQMLEEALKRNPTQRVAQYSIEDLVQNLRQIEWSVAYKRGADLYNAVLQAAAGEPLNDEQREQIAVARTHFETATLIWPDEGSAFTSLVFCHRQLGDLEGERAAIESALVKDPENGTVLLLAGERAISDGDMDLAIEYYQKAHELLPDNIDVMQRLTAAYLDVGKPEVALETLEKAQRYAPRDPDVYFNLGAVYANIGNDALEKGQDLYREAVGAEEMPYEKMAEAVEFFKRAQRAYSESLYFMDNTIALNPEDTSASNAVREIQNTKKTLDMMQRSAEEILQKQ